MIGPTYQVKFLTHCDFVACCGLIIGGPINIRGPGSPPPGIDAPAFTGLFDFCCVRDFRLCVNVVKWQRNRTMPL